MYQRIGTVVGPAGFIIVFVLGQLHAWWFVRAWKPFVWVVASAAMLVEALYYLSLPGNARRKERVGYGIVIGVLALSLFLDEPLRSLGGMQGYLVGAALQHLVFFFLFPRWLQGSMGQEASLAICGGAYCWFHLPNMPLAGITFVAGAVFVLCYRQWKTNAFPVMVILHYAIGSVLHGVHHLNMRVGVMKMPLKEFLGF